MVKHKNKKGGGGATGSQTLVAPQRGSPRASSTTADQVVVPVPNHGTASPPPSPKAAKPDNHEKSAPSPGRSAPPAVDVSPRSTTGIISANGGQQAKTTGGGRSSSPTAATTTSSWANVVKKGTSFAEEEPAPEQDTTTATPGVSQEELPPVREVPEAAAGVQVQATAPEVVASAAGGQGGVEVTPEQGPLSADKEVEVVGGATSTPSPVETVAASQEEAMSSSMGATAAMTEASPESTEEDVVATQQPEVVSQQEEMELSPEVVRSPASSVKEAKEDVGPEVDSADTTKTEAGSEEVKPDEPKPEAAPEKPIEVGQEVETTWGRGVVKLIREDGVFEVKGNSWKMAGGQTPTYFLQRKELREVTPYTIWKWSTWHKIERAKELKEEGTRLFRSNDVEGANKKYEEAIQFLRMTNDDAMTNKEKAQKLEVLIPVLNNVASCGIKSKRFKDAVVAASTTVRLIEEIFKNRGAEVMNQLRLLGLSDEQIFVTWKRKAAFMSGKCLLQMKEYEKAIQFLDIARGIVAENGDPELKSSDAQDILRLMQTAQAYLRAETRQQQGIWSKALSSFSEEEAKLQERTQTASPPASKAAASAKASSSTSKASPTAKKTPKKSKALAKSSASWWADNQEWLLPLGFMSFMGLASYGVFVWARRKK